MHCLGETALLEEKLRNRAIQKTAGVCGGHARIRNTRIPVWTLVSFRLQGADEVELLHNYPDLKSDDLQADWTYYEHHREEIDRAIAAHNIDDEDG